MKVHSEIKVENINIEQARNGFTVNYWDGNTYYREIFFDWKEVIEFIKNVEIN